MTPEEKDKLRKELETLKPPPYNARKMYTQYHATPWKCDGKRKLTREAAEGAAQWYRDRGQLMTPYPCNCGGWHIGHGRSREKRVGRFRKGK